MKPEEPEEYEEPPEEQPDWVENGEPDPEPEMSESEREHYEYEERKSQAFWKERMDGEDDQVRLFKPFGHNRVHPMLIDDFVWHNTITFLYGDAGTGKSWIALALATCTALGIPFLGRNAEQRNVLYVDTELSYDDLSFRAEAIARGLGQLERPHWLFYWRLPLGATLLNPSIIEGIQKRIRNYEIGFTVIDSLTIGSIGAGTRDSDEVVKTLNGLSTLGTVMIVDHTAKAQGPPLRPIGPTMKYALGRSQIALSRYRDWIKLEQNKPTFGPKPTEPIFLQINFTDLYRDPQPPTVTITQAPMGYDGPRHPTVEELIRELLSKYDRLGAKFIAQELGQKQQLISNTLQRMRSQGQVTVDTRHLWSIT